MILTVKGLILAGGRSQRMGTDKAGLMLANQTLLQRCITLLSPQVESLAINSNNPSKIHHSSGLSILPDLLSGYLGPLAGVHAGLKIWPDNYVLTVAVDLPFLPKDLLSRLYDARENSLCTYASSGKGHALAILWPPGQADGLAEFIHQGKHSVMDWLRRHGKAVVFASEYGVDVDFNINTAEDLQKAELRIANRG